MSFFGICFPFPGVFYKDVYLALLRSEKSKTPRRYAVKSGKPTFALPRAVRKKLWRLQGHEIHFKMSVMTTTDNLDFVK